MNASNTFVRPPKKEQFSLAITSSPMQSMIAKALGSQQAAARLTSTLISAVSTNEKLRQCEPATVVGAALRGEGMGLIYGHGYYLVPYGSVATYMMSYKGYISLAMSTGFYSDMDAMDVREGEYQGRDPRTGKPIIDLSVYKTDEERQEKKIIGYYAYYILKDGTFRFEYWTMDRLLKHADRYSKAFSIEKYMAMKNGDISPDEKKKLLDGTPWYDENDGQPKMCKKTLLRQLLNSGYAPLSNEVRSYISADTDSDSGIVTSLQDMIEKDTGLNSETITTECTVEDAESVSRETFNGENTEKTEKIKKNKNKIENFEETFFEGQEE